jgi:hypothetical protein
MTGNAVAPPSTPEPPTDVIVKVTPIVAAISWSAINQSVRQFVIQLIKLN